MAIQKGHSSKIFSGKTGTAASLDTLLPYGSTQPHGKTDLITTKTLNDAKGFWFGLLSGQIRQLKRL